MLCEQQVMNALATRMTGLPLAGARVYTSRAWPLKVLPAWRVVTPDEDIEPQTVHPNSPQTHALQIELQGYAEVVDDLDDSLSDLQTEALKNIFSLTPPADALTTLMRGKVKLTSRRVERTTQSEGQASLGRVQITLRAEFRTKPSDPETFV